MNQARSETDVVRLWINSLSVDFKQTSGIISLSEETLNNLLKNLIIFFVSKSSKKGYNIKSITKNGKTTLEIRVNQEGFETILENYFYKKQINSSWTYLKFRHYLIKWPINIHLITSQTKKAYYTKQKKKAPIKDASQKKQLTNFSDYFEQESDDEN